jgi:hypothetical protein
MVPEKLQCYGLKSPGGRRDLCEDIDAIRLIVHHAGKTPYLALDTSKASTYTLLLRAVSSHLNSLLESRPQPNPVFLDTVPPYGLPPYELPTDTSTTRDGCPDFQLRVWHPRPMFLIRLAFRLMIGVVVLVLVGAVVGNLWARSRAETLLADHVKTATGAQTVSAKVTSWPFLWDVLFSRVPQVQVVAHEVPVGRLDLSQVTVDARQVKIDREELVSSRKVHVTAISSATVTLLVETRDLPSFITLPSVGLSVIGDRQLDVSVDGHQVATFDLAVSPLIPPCDYVVTQVAAGFQLSCTVAPVPQSLLATLSTEKI